mmetsp:Transcript_12572/g.34697  ORF Transcript_12572/g.34697 Transcript_12572/m.34697 type:complete len:212 (+) Transcript_12572:836-1471(+)
MVLQPSIFSTARRHFGHRRQCSAFHCSSRSSSDCRAIASRRARCCAVASRAVRRWRPRYASRPPCSQANQRARRACTSAQRAWWWYGVAPQPVQVGGAPQPQVQQRRASFAPRTTAAPQCAPVQRKTVACEPSACCSARRPSSRPTRRKASNLAALTRRSSRSCSPSLYPQPSAGQVGRGCSSAHFTMHWRQNRCLKGHLQPLARCLSWHT